MTKSAKALFFAATITYTIVAVYCVTPDFSDYHNGVIRCNADRKTMKLGYPVSNENKHLMEVQNFKNRMGVKMYARIAPKSDSDEVKAAKSDYEETKNKFEKKHPDTVSYKVGQPARRVIGIPDFGFGSLTKEGKDTVPCYYFVVEYCDDYSDYVGGTIVCQDSSLIELEPMQKGSWKDVYTHTLKVKTIKGKKCFETYVRIAPLFDFNEVVTTIGDWENTMLEIQNPTTISFNKPLDARIPMNIPSEGNGVLKKDGKDDIVCYYLAIEYKHETFSDESGK